MTEKQFKQTVLYLGATLLFLFFLGFLSVREGIQEQREQISTFEKELEAERESFAVQEEALTREITRYKDKNSDLERTNDILTDYIQMKQQEVEEWKSWQ